MLTQPQLFALAEILDFILPVAVPDHCCDCHRDYFIQIMPHLRLPSCISYFAEAFFHHSAHLYVFFLHPPYNPFGNFIVIFVIDM